MRLTSVDLDSDNDSEKRPPVENVNNSGSFFSRTSSDPLNSEKNESAQCLFVPSNTVVVPTRTQRTEKNEYVEVYTDDDKSVRKLDMSDVNGDRSLDLE